MQGSFEVLQGPPADAKASISAALCERARSDSAAAVVIASASRGGLREAVFGSVAANLVRDCPAPVAVVVLHKPREDSSSSGSGSSEHGVAWLMRATAQEVLGDAVAGHVEEAAPATAEVSGIRVQPLLGQLHLAVLHAWFAPAPAADIGAVPYPLDFVASQPPAQQPQPQEQQHKARRALVVAVDDSDEGYAAVDWVLRHMWLPDDELHILHVVPVLSTHLSCSLAPGEDVCTAGWRHSRVAWLMPCRAHVSFQPVDACRCLLAWRLAALQMACSTTCPCRSSRRRRWAQGVRASDSGRAFA